MGKWVRTDERLPEEGTAVDWIGPDGTEVRGGTFAGGDIWMLPGGEVYVYYTPVCWRPSAEAK